MHTRTRYTGTDTTLPHTARLSLSPLSPLVSLTPHHIIRYVRYAPRPLLQLSLRALAAHRSYTTSADGASSNRPPAIASGRVGYVGYALTKSGSGAVYFLALAPARRSTSGHVGYVGYFLALAPARGSMSGV